MGMRIHVRMTTRIVRSSVAIFPVSVGCRVYVRFGEEMSGAMFPRFFFAVSLLSMGG